MLQSCRRSIVDVPYPDRCYGVTAAAAAGASLPLIRRYGSFTKDVTRWPIQPSHRSAVASLLGPGGSPHLNFNGQHRLLRSSINRLNVHKAFSTTTLVGILTPPAVFLGLVLALWAYKCLMMIIFQNRIIYMPSVPPFSRSEKLETYARECLPVHWKEETIESPDGTRLKLVVGSCSSAAFEPNASEGKSDEVKQVVIVYFQGNASSLPPRLPMLSSAMRAICSHSKPPNNVSGHMGVSITLIALSYRGFWTSAGRPSQAGIEQDAEAVLRYARRYQDELVTSGSTPLMVLWGQSIGAGIATRAAANFAGDAPRSPQRREQEGERSLRIDAIVLETPFTSIRNMLVGLYPQKWLPYRYLWPFLRNWWDSEAALVEISTQQCLEKAPKLLILGGGKDEVVPVGESEKLAGLARELGMDVEMKSIRGALHHEAMLKREGREALAGFVCRLLET